MTTDQFKALSPITQQLFADLVNDAGNWSGTPCWGGNVGGSREDNGNLSHIKKAGMLTTFKDEGLEWVCFTAAGKAMAAALGLDTTCLN